MIVVLLLLFQSLCLYCQRLVLHVYDRWINPENVRLLTETAESSCSLNGNRKPGGSNQQTPHAESAAAKRAKKRHSSSAGALGGAASVLPETETCRFCANTPQGYCRHHFHLQELQLQQQQQKKRWMPLALNADKSHEYRQLRKINRELKRNLKNRLHAADQYKQQSQQQQQQTQSDQQPAHYSNFHIDSGRYRYHNDTLETATEDSGYYTTSPSSCNFSQRSASTANCDSILQTDGTASENNGAESIDIATVDVAATEAIYDYIEPLSTDSSKDSRSSITTTYL